MSIKLQGATSGSIELDVPAAVSGGDISLTLPNGVGSAGQYLRNSNTAGTLEFGALPVTATSGIIQVAQAVSDTEFDTTSTTFVNTGLITVNFSNPIQSGSKVLASVDLSFGETHSGSWGKPHYFTLYEGTSGSTGSNIGDANLGIGGANAISLASSNAGNYNQYDIQRFSAKHLHTPSSTDPYYRLFVRSIVNDRSVYIGSASNTNTLYNVGRTIVTIMEVAS